MSISVAALGRCTAGEVNMTGHRTTELYTIEIWLLRLLTGTPYKPFIPDTGELSRSNLMRYGSKPTLATKEHTL